MINEFVLKTALNLGSEKLFKLAIKSANNSRHQEVEKMNSIYGKFGNESNKWGNPTIGEDSPQQEDEKVNDKTILDSIDEFFNEGADDEGEKVETEKAGELSPSEKVEDSIDSGKSGMGNDVQSGGFSGNDKVNESSSSGNAKSNVIFSDGDIVDHNCGIAVKITSTDRGKPNRLKVCMGDVCDIMEPGTELNFYGYLGDKVTLDVIE
jgi:hypothetical protein